MDMDSFVDWYLIQEIGKNLMVFMIPVVLCILPVVES